MNPYNLNNMNREICSLELAGQQRGILSKEGLLK
jgi:hypothetical protein